MTILKPKTLQRGDLIGLTAPSLPLFESARPFYDQAKTTLQSFGYQLIEGETLQKQYRWSAGTAQQQADELNSMFANPDIKAIIAHTGGFSSMSVIDLLDYNLIAQNPKPFIGLSDITVYHWAMYTKTGLVGFHGNDFTFGFGQQFADQPAEKQTILENWYQQGLTQAEPLGGLPFSQEWEVWRTGEANGRLLGGNLKRFMLLAGTDYFPQPEQFDGAILFWEDIGESYYDIAIYLQKLKHMGILGRISGMIVGQPVWINTFFDDIEHPTLKELVLEETADFNFPILNNIQLGHHTSSLLLPIGLEASMDTATPRITILESAVCD